MTWIHLQKLLPVQYQRDLIKAGINQLETAVERIRAFERADTAVRLTPVGLYRAQSGTAVADQAPQEPMKPAVTCYVCGLSNHVRNTCPFRNDICGQCERRGHLGAVCRDRPQHHRDGGRGRGRSWGNGRQSVQRGMGQAVHQTSTVAPLTWSEEDQKSTQLFLQQHQPQRSWMLPPPPPVLQPSTTRFLPEPLQQQPQRPWMPPPPPPPERQPSTQLFVPEQLQQQSQRPWMPPPPLLSFRATGPHLRDTVRRASVQPPGTVSSRRSAGRAARRLIGRLPRDW